MGLDFVHAGTYGAEVYGNDTVTAANSPLGFVNIGHWGVDSGNGVDGYDAAGNVRNALGDTFIDRDSERFYIRVIDPSRNLDPAAVEDFLLTIGTTLSTGAVYDNKTEIRLVETGPDTGVFVSKSQLLTTHDIPGVPTDDPLNNLNVTDDGFRVNDGFTGPVKDDTRGDRTHQVDIDGAVRVVFTTNMVHQISSVPVFQRAPDFRRELHMRTIVFNEPYQDVGYDNDANPGTPNISTAATAASTSPTPTATVDSTLESLPSPTARSVVTGSSTRSSVR